METLNDQSFKLPRFANTTALLLAAPFAVYLLAFPQAELGMLGVTATPTAVLLMRMYATSLVQVSVVSAIALKVRERRFLRGLALANAMQDTCLSLTFLGALTQGLLPLIGWGYLALFVFQVLVHSAVVVALRPAAIRPATLPS